MTDLKRERLIAHRELQLLRAAGARPKMGKRAQRQWIRDRARKLDRALGSKR